MASSAPPCVAVIDVGSNSIKLLVAARERGARSLDCRLSETAETRISGGIGGVRPRLADAAIAAGCAAVKALRDRAAGSEPLAWAVVATSAVRDAGNGAEFADELRKTTGLDLRILDGDEEARAIGRGLALDPAVPARGGFNQFDLGGGSLEWVRFADREVVQAFSLPLGAVRLTEHHIADPALPLERDTARKVRDAVQHALADAGVTLPAPSESLVATGGGVTVARAVLAAARRETLADSRPEIHRSDLEELRERIGRRPLDERLQVAGLPAARADIFPAAIEIVDAVLDFCRRDACIHSFFNLRHGIADQLLADLEAGSV